jgi:glycerol-3-phosphate dehydrogenase
MTALTDAPSLPPGSGAPYDLLVVGGGVNGAGIARDAAGRGLSVLLVEAGDLAGQTSSASTKLIHGGLRYLEYYEFRLVRESLIERERLLAIAPHIIWPLRFVLPMPPSGRPGWMIRAGLFLYDHIGGRKRLPGSEEVDLARSPMGKGLKGHVKRGFAYSDCWVEDSRLVVLNALDAAERGAAIRTRTRLVALDAEGGGWRARIRDEGQGIEETIHARVAVNAAGARVAEVLETALGASPGRRTRLVKGSHIVVPRLFEGEHAFILQNPDKRIVFAIPYEGEFTLIGTTDLPWSHGDGPPRISPEEVDYLCTSVNRYLEREIGPGNVVHSYSGVRPLFDDGASSASAVTRDYVLDVDEVAGAPILSVFGGKITTYRRLAEHALDKLDPHLPAMRGAWTAEAPLPGGDIAGGDFHAFLESVRARWPFLPEPLLHRLGRAYGTRVTAVLGKAARLDDLGRDLGGGLYTNEIDYLADVEWAQSAQDILWRRSKLGLHVGTDTVAALEDYLAARRRGE